MNSVPPSTIPANESDGDNRPSLRAKLGVGCLCVLVFLIGYVLTAGPMAWVHKRVNFGPLQQTIETVYYPIAILAKRQVPVLSPIIRAYVRLFR